MATDDEESTGIPEDDDTINAMNDIEWRAYVRGRLDKGDKRFERVEAEVKKNTLISEQARDESVEGNKKIDQLSTDLQEVIAMARGTRWTAKVARASAKALHKFATLALPIILFLGAIALWIRTGRPPAP